MAMEICVYRKVEEVVEVIKAIETQGARAEIIKLSPNHYVVKLDGVEICDAMSLEAACLVFDEETRHVF